MQALDGFLTSYITRSTKIVAMVTSLVCPELAHPAFDRDLWTLLLQHCAHDGEAPALFTC